MMLSLYERKNLAWGSGLKQQPESATEFSFGHLWEIIHNPAIKIDE